MGFRRNFISVFLPKLKDKFHEQKFNTRIYSPSALRWHMLATGLEEDFPTVSNAGWHFSTLGGFEKIRTKLESFAHHDQFDNDYYKSDDYIVKRMIRGQHLYTQEYYGNAKLEIQDLSFLPKYVQDNIGKYEKYII
jgi:hypothetical protein